MTYDAQTRRTRPDREADGTGRTSGIGGADGALLSVRRLHVYARPDRAHGPRTLVRDVGFDLAPGRTLGVVGESGSGKTLTARAVTGVLDDGLRAEGQVLFDGIELLGRPERELRPLRGGRLAMVLQDPFTALNPLLTVRAQLRESLAPGTRRDRVLASAEISRRLREVGLDPDTVAGRYPFQLSGGMRQRVAIAAALARDPELLIADEPTTALDATTQAEVLALLRRLQADRGMALLLITHDLRVAFSVCDRVLVMYAGSVLEDAPAAALARSPRHPYSLGLMLAEPPVSHFVDRLVSLPGQVPAADGVADTCAFADRCEWRREVCTTTRPGLTPLPEERASACVRIPEIDDELRTRLLGRVRKVPPARRRPARPLAAPGEAPRTTSTRDSARHAESTHRTPPGPPSGRTTGLYGHDLVPTTPGTPPVTPDGAPFLTVEGLGKTYGRSGTYGRMSSFAGPTRSSRSVRLKGTTTEPMALRDVSFELREGESLGVVGESGSGKTTLARCLLGLTRPTTGTIRLGGVDVSDYRKLRRKEHREARRLVQMVFQDPYSSLNPRLSIGTTLGEAVTAGPDPAQRPAELLERVGLPASYARKQPGELSGGERQRVAIARALAVRPRLLVCDEPVAALDVSVQAQILQLLREVRAGYGTSLIVITHDLSVVRQLTDRALVLHGGEIVESGETAALLDSPRHPHTQRLIASIPGGN
ncbi:dipeptide ABC transporter ATP-binding protein [Streptomyces geranii]|uniref:dipeptide ABC transporter ATP-binding protein n=1 Tax=Streptomyces geranii TaxID=2058923 RepID=UPI001E3CA09E|nr:ABC transporter ATP-binding protein [Streptomyces geranii]